MRVATVLHALVLALALLGLATGSGAITFLDRTYGTPTGTALGRGAAMGSTGASLYQGSQAVVQNPALLALPTERVHVDFLFGVTHAAEDWLLPLYDSFNAYVDETTISTNRNTYSIAQGGIVWHLPLDRPMTLAAGVYERYDFDYDYFEEVRNPTPFTDGRDALLGARSLAVEGLLRSVSIGYGAEAMSRINLGFSMHYYFGEVDYVEVDSVVTETSAPTSQSLQRDLGGWGWSVGAHGRVNAHLDLGAAFEGPFKVKGTHQLLVRDTSLPDPVVAESTSEETIEYPGALRFGATYRPQNPLATTFAVEAVYRFWEDLDDSFRTTVLQDTFALRDTWDLRLGLEHVFYNGLPVRFGFRYLENYDDPEAARSIYSAGLGYLFAGTRLDLTVLYHRQTSRQPFLFDPSISIPSEGVEARAPNSDLKVQDSVLQLVFGFTRAF